MIMTVVITMIMTVVIIIIMTVVIIMIMTVVIIMIMTREHKLRKTTAKKHSLRVEHSIKTWGDFIFRGSYFCEKYIFVFKTYCACCYWWMMIRLTVLAATGG